MKYEEYIPYWQEQVRALAERVFGVGYFATPSEIAGDPSLFTLVCRTDDDQLAGFAQGRILPKDGFEGYIEGKIRDIPDDLREADRHGALGVLHTVAVAPEYRGQGIGTTLLTVVHDRLVGRGADKLVVIFKRGPRASRVEGVMGRLGFQFWTRMETFWRDRCDRGVYACADRTDRCACEALFYRKIVF